MPVLVPMPLFECRYAMWFRAVRFRNSSKLLIDIAFPRCIIGLNVIYVIDFFLSSFYCIQCSMFLISVSVLSFFLSVLSFVLFYSIVNEWTEAARHGTRNRNNTEAGKNTLNETLCTGNWRSLFVRFKCHFILNSH